MKFSVPVILLLLGPIFHIEAQKLSRKEKRIIEIVEKNNNESIAFLEKIVNINSGTMNLDGVREVGMLFKEKMDEIGMETKWIEAPEQLQRAGHLFAEQKGKKGKKLLLIGHLDTVFEKDSPFQEYVDQDTIALGPGTNDMKSGDVAILYALKALYEARALKNTQIIVALLGDEEMAGRPTSLSRKDLTESAKRSDIALGFETATGVGYATIARRGSANWTLKVEGVRAHSSGIFRENVGAGAVFEASRILHEFYQQLPEEYLTFNPGIILGGSAVEYDEMNSKGNAFGKSNVVARNVVVNGGIRFISDEQLREAQAKMIAIVDQNLPKTSATIIFEDDYYPAMSPTEGNMEVLQVLNQVSIDLGHDLVEPWDPARRGAGDISFIAQYVDALDGLGTEGGNAHAEGEYVDLTTFDVFVQRAALLIFRLTR